MKNVYISILDKDCCSTRLNYKIGTYFIILKEGKAKMIIDCIDYEDYFSKKLTTDHIIKIPNV